MLAKADKETRLGIRKAERTVAEPVKADAQKLAARQIKPGKVDWTGMRIGITQKLVYIAPKTKRTVGSPRRKFGTLLRDKAMLPAVERNREATIRAFQNELDHMAEHFNRG